MAYCTFHNVALTTDTPLGTSHTLNRPSNMLAGSIEFLVFSNGTSQVVTAGLGSFTELYTVTNGGSRSIYYRETSGTEGASPTVVVTTGTTNSRLSCVAFEVRGWNGADLATDVVLATPITYVGTAPSPFAFPTATATWGVEENSFLAIYQCDGINNVLSLPTDYTLIGTAMAANSASAGVSVSYKNVAAASETPPPITMTNQRTGITHTIAIRSEGGTAVSALTLSDTTVYNGQTGVTITGSGFGASQGAGSVKICPTDNVNDASGVTQTVTAWSATSVTITAVRGTLAVATPMYLFLTNNSLASNSSGASVQIVYDPIYLRWTT